MSYISELRAIHGGRAKYIAKEGDDLLDFSASINPFPPKIDLSIPVDAIIQYPDDEYSVIKQVIARHHGCEPENITVGNGSVEVIRTLCHTVLKPGLNFYVSPHTFAEYELSARLSGAKKSREEYQADLIFVCNPDNPSGIMISREEFRDKYSCLSKEGRIICVDEAFIDLAKPDQSVIGLDIPGLFILRSLTKSFAIPGIRFGYGIGDPQLIKSLEVMRPPWSVNAFAESVAISAFEHYDELKQSRLLIENEKSRIIKEIYENGWTCTPGCANYLLIETGKNAREITHLFHTYGIMVRDCSSFDLPTSIRIAIRKPDENSRFIDALRIICSCMH